MIHTLVIIANCSHVAKENAELPLFLEASEAIAKAANDEEEPLRKEKKERSKNAHAASECEEEESKMPLVVS